MWMHDLCRLGPLDDVPRRTRAAWLCSVTVLALSHVGFGVASGQEVPPLQGRVIDETTLDPIPGAVVSLGSGLEARADGAGEFSVPGALPGTHIMRVQAAGYVDVLEEIDMPPEATLYLSVQLSRIGAVLDGLLVTAGIERTRSGASETMTAADLIAREVLGASVTPRVGGQGGRSFTLRGQGSMVLGSEPAVYLDGIRIGGTLDQALDILTQIPAYDVEQIQVLRGPATTTMSGDADGVILVTRRSGRRD